MKVKVIVVFLCLLLINMPVAPETPIEIHVETSQDLKILSWNIYMLPLISLFNGNSKRAHSIADRLKTSDYQVIVFQEAFSTHCRKILWDGLKKAFPYQYGPINNTHRPFSTNSGLWVISKTPLVKLDHIEFSSSSGYDRIARKGAVLFQGQHRGAVFQLLATHLQADKASEIRMAQCMEIKEKLLDKYHNKQIPQLLCGDFNVDMDDKPNYLQMLQKLDAQNGQLAGDKQVTYDEVDNNLAQITNGRKRILDYVLVRNETKINRMERKVQAFIAAINGKPTHLSDHYAMEVQIEFQAQNPNQSELMLAMQ